MFKLCFFNHKKDRALLMSIFSELAEIKAAIAVPTPSAPVDISTLATSAEVAGVSAQITALDTKLGTDPAAV